MADIKATDNNKLFRAEIESDTGKKVEGLLYQGYTKAGDNIFKVWFEGASKTELWVCNRQTDNNGEEYTSCYPWEYNTDPNIRS